MIAWFVKDRRLGIKVSCDENFRSFKTMQMDTIGMSVNRPDGCCR